MKLVCISDTHNRHDQVVVPDGDVLIHAGDMTMGGRIDEVAAALTWIAARPHPHKVVIAGNHDWLFDRQPGTARSLLPAGVHYLEGEGVELDGVRFYGGPWQPEFGGWAFNLPRNGYALRKRWAAIPKDTDVLVTHGPPHGHGDRCPSFDGGGMIHVGDEALARAVARVRPRVHVFGHIHEGHGDRSHNGTRFVNAAICDGRYRPTNTPIVVEI